MQNVRLPSAAVPAELPASIRLPVVSPSPEPPGGDRWLHEIKHDGHRVAAIIDGRGGLKLISRRGRDRTRVLAAPFRELAAIGREIVLDGEVAVPDDRGVTHIGNLQDAILLRRPECLAYFAFDLLHLDGHDLRGCAVEERKALLRDTLDHAGCPRVVYLDHVIGRGAALFAQIQTIGAEGIVSKRLGSQYRGGPTRNWLKTKCYAAGWFVITGFQELGPGRLEALHVAEEAEGRLVPVGQVRFGFAGKGLWATLDARRAGSAGRHGAIPIEPLRAEVKFFGRHKGGALRDGVLVSVETLPVTRSGTP